MQELNNMVKKDIVQLIGFRDVKDMFRKYFSNAAWCQKRKNEIKYSPLEQKTAIKKLFNERMWIKDRQYNA